MVEAQIVSRASGRRGAARPGLGAEDIGLSPPASVRISPWGVGRAVHPKGDVGRARRLSGVRIVWHAIRVGGAWVLGDEQVNFGGRLKTRPVHVVGAQPSDAIVVGARSILIEPMTTSIEFMLSERERRADHTMLVIPGNDAILCTQMHSIPEYRRVAVIYTLLVTVDGPLVVRVGVQDGRRWHMPLWLIRLWPLTERCGLLLLHHRKHALGVVSAAVTASVDQARSHVVVELELALLLGRARWVAWVGEGALRLPLHEATHLIAVHTLGAEVRFVKELLHGLATRAVVGDGVSSVPHVFLLAHHLAVGANGLSMRVVKHVHAVLPSLQTFRPRHVGTRPSVLL
mmetsp:Transcript_65776/g.130329  ORF Transcript_65776/g.130329 Transcript_65776/m.130329 type:complete len:344 (-) Transcript_65776:45-1076(-)